MNFYRKILLAFSFFFGVYSFCLAQESQSAIKLRCASWSNASENVEKQDKLYIRSGKKYVLFSAYEMSFAMVYYYQGPLPIPICRKASPAELLERQKNKAIRKSEKEYIPLFTISIPQGMKDVGILFPPGDIKKVKPFVIDLNKNVFPLGTSKIYNLSKYVLYGQFAKEKFSIEPGRNIQTKMLPEKRQVVEVKLTTKIKGEWRLVHSSAAVFRNETRNLIFILEEPKKKPVPGEVVEKPEDIMPIFHFSMIQDWMNENPPPGVEKEDGDLNDQQRNNNRSVKVNSDDDFKKSAESKNINKRRSIRN